MIFFVFVLMKSDFSSSIGPSSSDDENTQNGTSSGRYKSMRTIYDIDLSIMSDSRISGAAISSTRCRGSRGTFTSDSRLG